MKNKDIYNKLAINNIVKLSLDDFLIRHEKNKNLRKLTWDEAKKLLFQYCSEKNETPKSYTKYENFNIGVWLQHQKSNITSKEDNLYKVLANNTIVKEELDRYLSNKLNRNN